MDDIRTLMRQLSDAAMDVVNLKINCVGGLTKARQFRDLCHTMGIAITIEDVWGGEIETSEIADLGYSTPKRYRFQCSAFHEYQDMHIASGGPTIGDGYMVASSRPGLGVTPNMESFDKPITAISLER